MKLNYHCKNTEIFETNKKYYQVLYQSTWLVYDVQQNYSVLGAQAVKHC